MTGLGPQLTGGTGIEGGGLSGAGAGVEADSGDPTFIVGTWATASAGVPRSTSASYPAGVQAGDIALFVAGKSGSAAWSVTPSGFTQIYVGERGALWWKLCNGSESGAINVQTTNNIAASIILVRGLQASPVDVFSSAAAVSAGNIPYPSITPTVTPSLVFAIGAGSFAAGTAVTPTGTNPTFTPLSQSTSIVSVAVFTGLSTSTSPLGTRNVAATGFTSFYHGALTSFKIA